MKKVPMTIHGSQKLKEELQYLLRVERPKIISEIAAARALGDLRENAEYHAAKERQGFIEGRIQDLEHKLSHSEIIDLSEIKNAGRVVFGSTVTLYNLETEQEVVYQIVGEDEADLKMGKISYLSPIARALIAKSEGEIVEVHAPSGTISYEISQVEYR